MKHLNPIFHVDSYKLSHYDMFPKGSNYMYSHLIPRNMKYLQKIMPQADQIVSFGFQYVVKSIVESWQKHFFTQPWAQVKEQMFEVLGNYGLTEQDTERFFALHKLGYLPLRIRTMPEGELVKPGIPLLTIENTATDFYWLTNYLESVILNMIYKPLTVATMMRELASLRNKYWIKTTGSLAGAEFGLHDFSFRGHSTVESAAIAGMAFTLYSKGSDNIPGVTYAQHYYNADKPSGSIAATEHSQTSLGIQYFGSLVLNHNVEDLQFILGYKPSTIRKALAAVKEVQDTEYYSTLTDERKLLIVGETFNIIRLLLETYPTGILAYVSDTYDFWALVDVILPAIKGVILERDGTLVIRPDSSDLVELVLGEQKEYEYSDFDSETESEEFLEDVQDTFRTIFKNNIDDSSYMNEYYEYFVDSVGRKFLINASAEIGRTIDSEDNDHYYVESVTIDTMSSVDEDEKIGLVRKLAKMFGTTTNEAGYKELDSHIRVVLGDGMTYKRIEAIYEGLDALGFASSNICLAPGAYLLSSSVTRDSLGLAVKAGVVRINDDYINVYKEPLTDLGKKSPRGFLQVKKQSNGEYELIENVTKEQSEDTELQIMFEDGEFVVNYKYEDICAKVESSLK